jgi:hypothetical protein
LMTCHMMQKMFCVIKLRNSFSVQVDKSKDFTNKGYVVAFVRFVNDGEIQENFFCCKQLPKKSKGQDIFNVLSLHLETKCLSWENH